MSDTSGWMDPEEQQAAPLTTDGWTDDLQQGEPGMPGTEGWIEDVQPQDQEVDPGPGLPAPQEWVDGMQRSGDTTAQELQQLLADPVIANDPAVVQAITAQLDAMRRIRGRDAGPYAVVEEGDHVVQYFPE